MFVFKDNPGNSLGFTNNTNNVYLLRQANFNQWNTFTENLTKIAEQTFGLRAEYGPNFALDMAVKELLILEYIQETMPYLKYFLILIVSKRV